MIPVFLFLFHKPAYKQSVLISLCTVIGYAVLRLFASRAFLNSLLTSYTHNSSSFHGRITMVPCIIRYELKDLIIPLPNLPIKEILAVNILFSYVIILFAITLFVLCGYIVYKIKREMFGYFLFFGIWFGIGILFHSQIIPLDVPLAKRWMYFPMMGLLGATGILVEVYRQKIPTGKYFLFALYGIYVFFFTVETSMMNTYWTTVHAEIATPSTLHGAKNVLPSTSREEQ